MKRIPFITLIFLMVISLLSGCGKKASVPIEPEYEFPTGWWKQLGEPPVVNVKYTDDPSNKDKKCFKIQGTTTEDNFGFVALTIQNEIPIGKKIKVEARTKTVEVTGNGPAITIRCDETPYAWGNAEQSVYSGFIGQKGTSDWASYSLELDKVIQPGIQSVTVYFIFSVDTSGIIYYDLVSLDFIEE